MTAAPLTLIDDALPAPVMEVVRTLQAAGFEAYVVGGSVRDLLRGKPPKDFDIATKARPEQVQKLFRKVFPTGIEHGTVTVLMREQSIEVTTFRTEGDYQDGRRPSSVSFDTDIAGDLSRRDFTFNAIAYDPIARLLVDPFGGQRDLQAGLLRAVGDPAQRFAEDGLRILRAIRFTAVLGVALDAATRAAIPGALSVFKKVSLERVHDEMVKLLLSDRPALGLQLLDELGLLAVILPGLEGIGERGRWIDRAPPVLEIRLALLLLERSSVQAFLLGLKFPGKVAQAVDLLVREAPRGDELAASDAQLRRWMARAGAESMESLLALALAREQPDALALQARVRSLLAARPPLRSKDLALGGEGIMRALGVGPSPVVGQATRFLLEAVLDQPERNTPEQLAELLTVFSALT